MSSPELIYAQLDWVSGGSSEAAMGAKARHKHILGSKFTKLGKYWLKSSAAEGIAASHLANTYPA